MKTNGAHRLGGQRGTTMIEMLITVAILGVLVGVIAKFVSDSHRAAMDIEGRGTLAAMTHVIDQNLRISLAQNKRLYCDMALQGNPTWFTTFNACITAGIAASSSGAPAQVPWAVTPQVQTIDNLVTYTASVATAMGDNLPFLAVVAPVRLTGIAMTIPAGTPTPVAAYMPVVEVTIDRYQMVLIYLSLDSSKKVRGLPGRLRLVEWRSKPYVDYSQLAKLPAGAQLTATVQALVARGYDYAFDASSNSTSAAFYALTSTSPYLAATTTVLTSVPEQAWSYVEEYQNVQQPNPDPAKPQKRVTNMNYAGGTSGFPNTFSVAYNTVSPSVNSGNKADRLTGGISSASIQVPLFAVAATATSSAFPAGFEVGVYGDVNRREIWYRSVLLAENGSRTGTYKEFSASEGGGAIATKNPD